MFLDKWQTYRASMTSAPSLVQIVAVENSNGEIFQTTSQQRIVSDDSDDGMELDDATATEDRPLSNTARVSTKDGRINICRVEKVRVFVSM